MPSLPSLRFVPLADVAPLLPADCSIAERLRADPEEFSGETAAWITGDVQWPELHLDTPLVANGGLHRLAQAQPENAAPLPRRAPFLILVEGKLRIDGALTTSNTDGTTHLVVLGSLHVQHAVIGGQLVHVQGALTVDELLWGHYNHGDLHVNGGLTARVALFTDEYHLHVAGGEQVAFLLDEARGVPSLAEFSAEVAGLVFAPEYFDGIDDGADGIGALLDRGRVVAAVRAGQSPVRTSTEITADMPLASDLFADEAISVANILAVVNSPIVTHKEKKAPGWFGQTDFSLCRRHVDADGDQRDDNVFITVWKTWDFYLSVEHEPTRKGLLARLAAAVLRRPMPFTEVATLLYRGYTEGTGDGWTVLNDEAPAEARAAATRAWRGVLDYVRRAVGQSRAGYPLYHRLQAELTPRRIEQFTSLPYFTEEYNDWWDSDRNGDWHGDVWVGARQPCLHEGEPYGRALKLSWENGETRPGDDSDDAYGAYQLDIDEARAGPPVVEFKYTQRQSEARTTLPRGAVDHIARLLRLYAQVEAKIQGEHDQQQTRKAEQRRIETAVQLLATPPLADDLPDAAVFPAELMLLSGRWQNDGEAYVAAIRAHQFAMTARAQEADDGADEEEEDEDQPAAGLPDDPRKASAPTVLQLARVVNRHADEALAERFRQRFAFAPDAYVRTASKAGQFIGPIFLLADDRIIARIGPTYSASVHWVQIDGPALVPLPALKGLGRSADGSCFAQSDGTHITTHSGFGGPQIARLPLPRGNESIPESMGLVGGALGRRCDEIIPFNDGQRVLLRNPTGVYLISAAHGVQRLHPQEFDEGDGDEDDGGPYTWPKNHQDAAEGEPDGSLLSMDMLHMALSPDERFIAVGDQDSAHILLDAQDGRPLRTLDTQSSYPHHARFSHDGTRLWFNSCHLYNGITIATPVDAVGDTEGTVVDAQWRVYASATLPGMVVMGDASGYVYAMDDEGRTLWRHHVGSSISAIEASPDGSLLLVGSYGGYLALLQHVETGLDPYSIGTSPCAEVRRWIFWDNEPTPLRW